MVIQASDMDTALRLFREGKSKAEIGKVLGRDKKQVGKILARAIKEMNNGNG